MAKYSDDIDAASRFLASTLHEIRTPIQTIISSVELLNETRLDTEQTEHVRQIQFSADVLLNLANTVLDMAKIRAGNFTLESIPFDMSALAEQVIDLVAIEAFNRGLEVVVDVDESVPALVTGDPVRVQQVMLNLVKNAVKFTQHGYVYLGVSAQDGDIMVQVKDSGIGIAPEQQEKVFDDYYQADVSTYRKYGGTGLGLSICRQLVSLMHGKIGVTSNPDGGSIFWVRLPLAKANMPTKTEPLLMPPTTRVLVVAGHRFSGEILQKKLTRLGLQNVTLVDNPADALEQLRTASAEQHPFGVAFINMQVASVDGFHLASLINDDKRINGVRLYLLVSEGQLGGEAKMKMLNWFSGYLYKPVKREKLRELLNAPYASKNEKIPELKPVDDEKIAHGYNVLIAEDHAVNRLLLSTFLQKFGATVFLAEDGQQAVDVIAAHPTIDMIFMDIQMPVMNGVDATIALRKGNYGGIIIACTANNDEGDFTAYRKIGINDILVKPCKSEKIKSLLEKWGTIMAVSNVQNVATLASARLQTLALWDRADFMTSVENDTSRAAQLLDDCIANSAGALKHIETLLEEKGFYRLMHTATALKSTAESVSSPLLAEYAERIIASAKTTDVAGIQLNMEQFKTEYEKFKTLAEKWKKTL